MSTHIFAPELSERAVRAALNAGHAYVSHDWMCDPTGFRFLAVQKGQASGDLRPGAFHVMGDELPHDTNLSLVAEFPVECAIRLLKNGEVVSESTGRRLEHAPDGAGTYRVEGWLKVDSEDRVWVYSNPIYLR
jgi:hypothetical protein